MLQKLCLVVLAMMALGCGSEPFQRGAVQGQITFDGQPVASGTITFVPIGASPGASASGEVVEGQFRILAKQGPSVGIHRVEVLAVRNNGQKEAGSPYPAGTMVDDIEQYIPARYNHKSELQAEVKSGDNTINFQLKPQ
ncbi:MAG: hypothetical protein ACKV2Q_16180 [Planctomycetaceae bacterium]